MAQRIGKAIVRLLSVLLLAYLLFVAHTVFYVFTERPSIDHFKDGDITLDYPHQYRVLEVNGVNINVLEAGIPQRNKVALLLHGFPETGLLCYHELIPKLVAEGYFVLAPDQRGYNMSSKPAGVCDYHILTLVEDMHQLISNYSDEPIHLVGHDWGAVVAYGLAIVHPEKIHKLVAVNVPHPTVMLRTLATSWMQMRMSWYIFFFQMPFIPEWNAARDNFTFPSAALSSSSLPQTTYSKGAWGRFTEAWAQPGSLRGMINWYRAAFLCTYRSFGSPLSLLSDQIITVPTLIIWGKLDKALSHEMAQYTLEYCTNGSLIYVDNGSHFVLHDEPDLTYQYISRFFAP